MNYLETMCLVGWHMGLLQRTPRAPLTLQTTEVNSPKFLKDSQIEQEIPFISQLGCLEYKVKQLFLAREENTTAAMVINYPVHQIWMALLHGNEEIREFEGDRHLNIIRRGEGIFFQIS